MAVPWKLVRTYVHIHKSFHARASTCSFVLIFLKKPFSFLRLLSPFSCRRFGSIQSRFIRQSITLIDRRLLPCSYFFFQWLPLFFSQLSLSESGCIFLLPYESGTISKTCFEYYVSTTYVPATFEYWYLHRYGINVVLEMKDFDNPDFFPYKNVLLK